MIDHTFQCEPHLIAMKSNKRARLESAGWQFGTVKDFLGLSVVESAIIEIRLWLSRQLRVAKIESEDPPV